MTLALRLAAVGGGPLSGRRDGPDGPEPAPGRARLQDIELRHACSAYATSNENPFFEVVLRPILPLKESVTMSFPLPFLIISIQATLMVLLAGPQICDTVTDLLFGSSGGGQSS